jgi:hypothetical protein
MNNSNVMPMRRPFGWKVSVMRTPALDHIVLLLILFAYLLLLPEAPHGDGVRWAQALESHRIEVNPNYLLMEPIALAVYSAWEAAGLPSNGTQFQKYLDVFVGIGSLFLLNRSLQMVAISPGLRRLCVVFAAFSYNFFYLATSDHIKLVTAPFLMLTIFYLLCYFKTHREVALIRAGLSMGLSLCTLVNVLPWFSLLLPLLFLLTEGTAQRRARVILIFGISATLPALLLLGLAYILSAPEKKFLSWLTSYGSNASAQEVGFGGLNLLTLGRALSAVIKNFVFSMDLGPMVKALALGISRPPVSSGVFVLNVLTFFAISWVLFRVTSWAIVSWRALPKDERSILLIMVAAVLGYFAFGLIWNSSEEEFWFQITAPIVLTIAIFMSHRPSWRLDNGLMAIAMIFVIANTLLTFALPRHAYPYRAYVADLSTTLGTHNLLIHDGSEPINGLVFGVKSKLPARTISITSALDRHGYDLGKTMASIGLDIQYTRDRGGTVYVMDIFSPHSTNHPWTLLRERFGIQKEDITSFLKSQGSYRSTQLADQPAWVLE